MNRELTNQLCYQSPVYNSLLFKTFVDLNVDIVFVKCLNWPMLGFQGVIWVAVMCLSEPYKDTKGGHTQQIKGLKEEKANKDSLKEISKLLPM